MKHVNSVPFTETTAARLAVARSMIVDSLAAMASITLFHTQEAPLDHAGLEAMDDSGNGYYASFRAGGETLFSFGEIWR